MFAEMTSMWIYIRRRLQRTQAGLEESKTRDLDQDKLLPNISIIKAKDTRNDINEIRENRILSRSGSSENISKTINDKNLSAGKTNSNMKPSLINFIGSRAVSGNFQNTVKRSSVKTSSRKLSKGMEISHSIRRTIHSAKLKAEAKFIQTEDPNKLLYEAVSRLQSNDVFFINKLGYMHTCKIHKH